MLLIQEHSQMTTLTLELDIASTTSNAKLFSRMSSLLPLLSSLHLVLRTNKISGYGLQSIASMKTLRNLSLSAGQLVRWTINHETMRDYLRELPLLEKLAFSGESYKTYLPEWSVYWPFNTGAIVRNYAYNRKVLDEAEKYAQAMPKLTRIYLSRVPMAVSRFKGGSPATVYALSEKLD